MAKKNSNPKNTSAFSLKGIFKKHVISRNVAANLRDYFLITLIFQAILLLTVLFISSVVLEEKKTLKSSREKEYLYWSNVADQFPNNPDILFNASKSAYENGNKEKAIFYIKKALQIDPLFEDAEKLLEEVQK